MKGMTLFSPMKNHIALAAALVALGALPGRAGILDAIKGTKEAKAPALDLRVDAADIDRAAATPASYAPVVDRVMPSVVSVFAYKMVRLLNDPRMGAYDDPFYQYFFGRPRGRRFQNPNQDEDQPQTEQRKVQSSLGSGVIVTADGYILTNHHVVDRADEIGVLLADGVDQLTAKVVGSDPSSDVAVLKIEGRNFPAVTLADSDRIRVGDIVLAVGNPYGVGETVTQGIVSAKHRRPSDADEEQSRRRRREVYEDYIQTDAAINFGNSGGALVDIQGRLIGLNTAIFSQTGGNIGIGFAVPVNIARYVLGQIVKSGKVNRGMLGIVIQDVNADFAEAFKLPAPKGALVGEVAHDSAAQKAGILARDVIVGFNGRPIGDSHELQVLTAHTEPGTEVSLALFREGKEQTVKATLGRLGSASGSAVEDAAAARAANAAPPESLFNGVEISELDAATRSELRAPEALKGVVVRAVGQNSRAAVAGLRENDVIVEIGDPPAAITNIDEAQRAAEGHKGHRVVLRVWREGASVFLIIPLR